MSSNMCQDCLQELKADTESMPPPSSGASIQVIRGTNTLITLQAKKVAYGPRSGLTVSSLKITNR